MNSTQGSARRPAIAAMHSFNFSSRPLPRSAPPASSFALALPRPAPRGPRCRATAVEIAIALGAPSRRCHFNTPAVCSRRLLQLLRFVAAMSRLPPGGLCALPVPAKASRQDTVIEIRLDDDLSEHHLPQSSTCFQTMSVPRYPSKGALKEKLLIALGNNDAPMKGF